MSEDLFVETQEPEVLEGGETNPAGDKPPSTEDIAKEYLKQQGIDPDAFDFKKASKLSEWEKSLNKKSSELGSIAKQLESTKTAPIQTNTSEKKFADEDLANLKDALKAVGLDPDAVMGSMSYVKQTVEEQRAEIASDFFTQHGDIDQDEIIKVMYEDGINLETITPARLKRELNKAYKLVKADTLDIDALVEQKLKERLDKLNEDGGELVEVRKGRGQKGGNKTLDDVFNDPSMDFFAKMDAAGKFPPS